MCCSGICRNHQPRAGNAGGKGLQVQLACQNGGAGNPGQRADFSGPGTLAGASREHHLMAGVRQPPGHFCEALRGPQPARKGGTHVDHRGARKRGGDGGAAQFTVQGVGVESVPLQQARPARPLVQFLDPRGPSHAAAHRAAMSHKKPWARGAQQLSALGAFAVQVDGDINGSQTIGQRREATFKPGLGQEFVAAHQVQRRGHPLRTGVKQPVARAGPAEGVESGNCHEKIAEAKGPEHQQGGAVTRVFTLHVVHRPAFRAAVSVDSILRNCPARCLGVAKRGNYVRMGTSETPQLRAVLFDRDGTLVVDVPYNGDPELVRAMPGAKAVLDYLRAGGLAVGVITNQSGVARGILTAGDVVRVNARVEELLGPFDVWEVCLHSAEDGCPCRKPAPGMVLSACRRLGIPASEAALIGDIGSDVQAADAAGARGILVPTPVTRTQEVEEAKLVARDLAEAVDLLLERA